MDILQKGKNRTSLQLGKNSNNGNPQGIFHTYYGVTDNLTLGLGVMMPWLRKLLGYVHSQLHELSYRGYRFESSGKRNHS